MRGVLMYSKVIQRTVIFTAVIIIFAGVYSYLANEYQKLPSENWSKDEVLFSYKTDTELEDFFGSQIAYIDLDESLSIVYIDNDVLRYKTYKKDLSFDSQGVLTSLPDKGEEISVTVYDNRFEMIIKVNDDFYCYQFDKNLKLKRTYIERIDQPNYYISNSHIVMKVDGVLKLVSSKGAVMLDMPYVPYDNIDHVKFDEFYTVHYLTVIDGERLIIRDEYDLEGSLKDSKTITTLLSSELRLSPLDFEVISQENVETYKINVKDLKSGVSYLNYYRYDLDNKKILVEMMYERFQDKTSLISQNELIGLYKGSEIASLIGDKYRYFYNVMIYDFDKNENRALTKTYNGPREYAYIQSDPYDYLIWGELKKGEMTVKIASDDPKYIESSQVFTRERILDVFYETIEAYFKIPTYIIINAVTVFAMTMLIVLPAYMLFVTFFEKHNFVVMLILMILHNIGKLILHINFISRIDLPAFLATYTIPIIIVTNLLAFYNYKVINHHKRLDNPIVGFIPFFITDILLHTFIFGPFIMMQL